MTELHQTSVGHAGWAAGGYGPQGPDWPLQPGDQIEARFLEIVEGTALKGCWVQGYFGGVREDGRCVLFLDRGHGLERFVFEEVWLNTDNVRRLQRAEAIPPDAAEESRS